MNKNTRFKDNLLKLMGEHSITYQHLADELAIDVRTIFYWIGKRSSLPNIITLIALADIFKTNVKALLD